MTKIPPSLVGPSEWHGDKDQKELAAFKAKGEILHKAVEAAEAEDLELARLYLDIAREIETLKPEFGTYGYKLFWWAHYTKCRRANEREENFVKGLLEGMDAVGMKRYIQKSLLFNRIHQQ